MAKTILIKRSRSQFPPEQLQFGELAFADESDRLFIGKADGSIVSGYLSERTTEEWENAIQTAIQTYAAPLEHTHSLADAAEFSMLMDLVIDLVNRVALLETNKWIVKAASGRSASAGQEDT
jgi:hypothetical protein